MPGTEQPVPGTLLVYSVRAVAGPDQPPPLPSPYPLFL